MPVDYKNYPKNWKTEIRPFILERAKNCCELCGASNYQYGFRDTKGIFYSDDFIHQQLGHGIDMFEKELTHAKRIKIVLTTAHLDHDIANNDYSNLKALCQRCHLVHDKEQHKKNRRQTLQRKKGLIELPFISINLKTNQ